MTVKPILRKKASNPNSFRTASWEDKLLDIIIWVLVLFAVAVTLYPFLYVVSVSISEGSAVAKGSVVLLPKGFSLDAFRMVTNNRQLWISYGNTFFYTLMGTVFNVLVTCLGAYPLSRSHFFLRKPLNFFVAFTMYFSGGLIPTYIVVTGIGLYNSRLAMILPVLVSAYNLMICRSAMSSVPQDLFENASLEGAGEFYMMLHIAIPLIKPTLAVLTLYYAVARYNDFFNAMLYLGDSNLQPLQIFLRRVLLQASNEVLQSAGGQAAAAAAENTLKIRYVCIVLAAVPIFVITPFVQKYLVAGTMLGAVKG